VVCRYPDVFKHAQHDLVVSEVPSPRQIIKLCDTPTMYSPDDMQLFHHYLIAAYPSIPHNFEEVWINDVPTQSHEVSIALTPSDFQSLTDQYSYLMNAMLALAGSHLAVQVENPKTKLALQHRQKAIIGLENAFTRWPPTASEAHVMLATSFLLSFQSSYMEDGFMEHFLSLRGCSLLSQLIINEGFGGLFVRLRSLDLIRMDATFQTFPTVDQELVCEALLSLKGFSDLMTDSDSSAIEKALVGQLVATLRYLLHEDGETDTESESGTVTPGSTEPSITPYLSVPSTSSSAFDTLALANPLLPASLDIVFQDIDWAHITTAPPSAPNPLMSFKALMATLTILATWPHDSLVQVFDPANQLGNIVMAHFCAVRFVLSPLSAPKHAMRTPTKAVVKWTARIIAAVDEGEGDWGMYVEWPRKILRCMQACVEKKRGFTMGDVRDMLVKDPGAFKEGRVGRL
jgi:hypothetical protein